MSEADRRFIQSRFPDSELIEAFARRQSIGAAGSANWVLIDDLLEVFGPEELDAHLRTFRQVRDLRRREASRRKALKAADKKIDSLERTKFKTKAVLWAIGVATGATTTIVGALWYESAKEWKADSERRAISQLEEMQQLSVQVRIGLQNVERAQTLLTTQGQEFAKRVRDIESERVAGFFETHSALLKVEAEGLMGMSSKESRPDPIAATRAQRLYELLLTRESDLLRLKRQAELLAGNDLKAIDATTVDQEKILAGFSDFFGAAKDLSLLRDERVPVDMQWRDVVQRLGEEAASLVEKSGNLAKGAATTRLLSQDDKTFWQKAEGFGHLCIGVASARRAYFDGNRSVEQTARIVGEFELARMRNHDLAWPSLTDSGVVEADLADELADKKNFAEAVVHRRSALKRFEDARKVTQLVEQLQVLDNDIADVKLRQGYECYQQGCLNEGPTADERANLLEEANQAANETYGRIRATVEQMLPHVAIAHGTLVEIRCLKLSIRMWLDDPKNKTWLEQIEKSRPNVQKLLQEMANERKDPTSDFGRACDPKLHRELFADHLANLRIAGGTRVYERVGIKRETFFKRIPTINLWLGPKFAGLDVPGKTNRNDEILDAAFPR